jgi:flagellar export protein FliJ
MNLPPSKIPAKRCWRCRGEPLAFRYRLEILLRLQRSVEHQEENRLLACAARIASLKNELQQWEEARLTRRNNVWADLEKGAPGTFLQFAALWDRAVSLHEKEILEKLHAAEKAREEQLHVYRAARRKREVLESLRHREETTHNSELLRRIQRELDDAHLEQSAYREPG